MRVVDLKHLVWDVNPTGTKGTAGTFLKAYEAPYYYKMSAGSIVGGIYGHEAVNEVIVSRLLQALGIECLQYTGFVAETQVRGVSITTYVCKSKEFKKATESKMTLEMFFALHHNGNENILQFLHRLGYVDVVNKLLLVDFLIINRDRHGANIEVLYDKSSKQVRIAPIFDNGVSFVAPYQNDVDVIKHFDPMRDVQANNFIGTYSLQNNLQYITAPIVVNAINDNTVNKLFYGLHDVITDVHITKIKEIIKMRYLYAKEKNLLCER